MTQLKNRKSKKRGTDDRIWRWGRITPDSKGLHLFWNEGSDSNEGEANLVKKFGFTLSIQFRDPMLNDSAEFLEITSVVRKGNVKRVYDNGASAFRSKQRLLKQQGVDCLRKEFAKMQCNEITPVGRKGAYNKSASTFVNEQRSLKKHNRIGKEVAKMNCEETTSVVKKGNSREVYDSSFSISMNGENIGNFGKEVGNMLHMGKKRRIPTCHQCLHSSEDDLVLCSRCRCKWYCTTCLATWYPAQTREKLEAACPYCLGNCNCPKCLLNTGIIAVDHLEIDTITKLKQLLYLIHKVSLLIWNIDLENTFELHAEMGIRGTELTSDDIMETVFGMDERIYCLSVQFRAHLALIWWSYCIS